MQAARIPWSLVLRKRGRPVMLAWLLALAGVLAALVGIAEGSVAVIAAGVLAALVGAFLLRRGLARGAAAYGPRRGRPPSRE